MNSLYARKYRFLLAVIGLIFLQTACYMPFLKTGRNFQNPAPLPFSVNQNPKPEKAEKMDPTTAKGAVEQEIYQLFMAKDFASIEKIANQARAKKERLTGGYWKIDSVYDALTTLYAEVPGQDTSDEMWQNRIELLKKWKEKAPESITARVALAKAFIDYGWFARGNGLIGSVSAENKELLQERLDLAENELAEARNLKAKCPRWYREALFIGMVTGWSLDAFDEIFDEAVKYEPDYLQFYLVKSENLTPKWNGENGDWQKFVDALPGKLATLETNEADIIYFLVVVNKMNERSLTINYAMISKERIKKGFADLEKKYGVDNFRLNQFAHVAAVIRDLPAAKEAFDRIGDDWNEDVWSEEHFRIMKQLTDDDANKDAKIARK